MYATLEELHKVTPRMRTDNNLDWQIDEEITENSVSVKHLAMEMIATWLNNLDAICNPPKQLTEQEFLERKKQNKFGYKSYLKYYKKDRRLIERDCNIISLDEWRNDKSDEFLSFNWCLKISGLSMKDFMYFYNGIKSGKSFAQCKTEYCYD